MIGNASGRNRVYTQGLSFVLLACACASDAQPYTPLPSEAATPAVGTRSQPAASPSDAPTAPSAPNAPASVPPGAAAAGPAAAAPPVAGSPAQAVPQTGAVAPTPPASTKRYPDACEERRGSWSRPCSDDPDPCKLNSGFIGDNYCLLPPPEGQGVQIHFGPSSYDDPAELDKYTIKPGEEFNQYAIVNVPTTEDHWYGYLKISMRPGSHHLINSLIEGHPSEGFVSGSCEGQSAGGFPGTQNLIVESPPQGIPAPENEGLGRSLPGNSSICQNYHRYNTTDKPALSEIWYNVWFIKEEEITQRATGLSITAGPFAPIPARSMQLLTTTSTMSNEGRIISLFGHRHAATERFAVWLNDDLIYDSWDWMESRLFNYDSLTMNPAPMPDKMVDGAASGIMAYKRGDAVKVECHVNNTTDTPLRFANELYTGEMCILFGSTVTGESMEGRRPN